MVAVVKANAYGHGLLETARTPWDALPRVFWVLLGRSAEASKWVVKSRKTTFPAEYISEARWLVITHKYRGSFVAFFDK